MFNQLLPRVLCANLVLAPAAMGAEVWTGTDLFFEKDEFADWTLPENQDRITGNVWLTRANARGLFNIAEEGAYENFVSPIGTEWAYGSATDWESLTFQVWVDWVGGIPPTSVGVEAVVHLIQEDIYLDIRFESWSIGDEGGGGGFSYYRARDPGMPIRATTWGRLKHHAWSETGAAPGTAPPGEAAGE